MASYGTVMVLGGTGLTGRLIAEQAAETLGLNIVLAGRNGAALEDMAASLRQKLPERSFDTSVVDITNEKALTTALAGIDLLVVSAPVADLMDSIAEAALASGTDMIDILVRPLAAEKILAFDARARAAGRTFITQAGFHPGVLGPIMRMAGAGFSRLDEVHVGMAMQASLRDVNSASEIVSEVAEPTYLLDAGEWRQASYKDMHTFAFAPPFGKRACYPLNMREVATVGRELGLKKAGAYSSGFNWFIDYLVFPLLFAANGLGGARLANRVAPLFYYGNKWFSPKEQIIEIRAEATGEIDGKPTTRAYSLSSREPYAVTARCVIAALEQMIDGPLSQPGVLLMGERIDHQRLFAELEGSGAKVWTD